MVPLPGSARPMISARQFMELAVNRPEHEPHVGHAAHSMALRPSSSSVPACTCPTASNTLFRSIVRPSRCPASMGPPLTMTAGTLRRTAAMSMPGTILSQHGTSTSASKACALAIDSTVSAMSSRLGSEKCMPAWFMARPSQMPMTPNSKGTPPAPRTPALTASTTLSRCMWPGTTSLKELAMPTNGRSISASVTPSARSRARCGARATPSLISSLLTILVAFRTGRSHGKRATPAPSASGRRTGSGGRRTHYDT